MAQLYGVFRPDPKGGEGDLMHGTFVIDRKGKIVWINAGDEPFTENRTLLVEIARAEGGGARTFSRDPKGSTSGGRRTGVDFRNRPPALTERRPPA